ncbi:MAG TPA: MBL fold metallo-hydrolase [Termitinemataceae bacterium]|nr:MBL fold metallo-hydrolase [Termitinemataceae bacterium]HOM22363.1 MBL fold metallo-hydrolase [Termitinemataceae bacterium]HPP99637.1 MBL fold metallo-hydrolase [Termitinemataceae bacterium]
MQIRFWGVRGSLPAPPVPQQIKSKISAIIERITPDDIKDPTSKERFLSRLPPWLFGTVGGNTPCLEVRTHDALIIFDAGTGIRELGIALSKDTQKPSVCHIFFSHLHWDHIQGLPFFGPAYNPSMELHFYSPHEELEAALQHQMRPPSFPITMDSMGAKKHFHHLTEPVVLANTTVSFKKMNHPGASYAYLVDDGLHRFLYATDTELSADDFQRTDENAAFFGGVDALVIDAQYTLGEAIEKYNWGHSAFSLAVDFASNWGIANLYLFHHDPTYDDKKLYNILQNARWYVERMAITGVQVHLATEGLTITL